MFSVKIQEQPAIIVIGKKSINQETTLNVTIPGGVLDKNILRLSNMGNYFNAFMRV